MSLVEIKYFNALIENKPFFDHPVKNKQEAYEKLIEIPRNYDYIPVNLLNYHQNLLFIIKIIINSLV